MKKIQVILSAVAVMLAVAGVYASSMVTTTYYAPNYANRAGLSCDILINDPCTTNGSVNCTTIVEYFDDDQNSLGSFTVLVGEKPASTCIQSTRQ